MQMPMIHLNGTSRDVLLEQYCEAVYAMNDAIAAVQRIDINGRDYYPISDNAANIAINEHKARLTALDSVWRELTAIAENISD